MIGDLFNNLVGNVTVSETNKYITITGINRDKLRANILTLWGTSRIFDGIVERSGPAGIKFHSFFAVDLKYIFEKIASAPQRIEGSKRAYTKALELLVTNTWLKNINSKYFKEKLDYNALKRLNVKLYDHQMEFLKVYDRKTQEYELRGYLLGAAPGSGKTITGYALSECLNTNTTFCIVPKNAVERVWVATAESIFKEPVKYWYSTSNMPIEVGKRYYIAHYEQLDKVLEFVRKNKSQLGTINIVLDESHNFNDLKSERTKRFVDLVRESDSISTIFSSGTPVKAMGSEVIPIMRCIDAYFNEATEKIFKEIFGVSSTKALDILANRMGLVTFKVVKANVVGNKVDTYDVDVTMPTGKEFTLDNIRKLMTNFVLERTNFYKKNMNIFLQDYFNAIDFFKKNHCKSKSELEDLNMYLNYAKTMHKGYDSIAHAQLAIFCNNYEKKVIIPKLPPELKTKFVEAKSVYKYVQLKIQGEALGRILGKARTQCNVNMVRAMDNYVIRKGDLPLSGINTTLPDLINQGKKKTVIFTSYIEVVDVCNEILKERGFKPIIVYGDTNKDLPKLVSDFEKIPDLNPIIATYQSLSTAVPLIMANQGVMLNAPFRIHEYEQAVSRMDRIGQTETVNIFNIFLNTGKEVNISTRSVDIMAWSKTMVDSIMGIDTSNTPNPTVEDIVITDSEPYTDFEEEEVLAVAKENMDKPYHDKFFAAVSQEYKAKYKWS